MNVISVQIYTDQNTPWDRTKIEFPIDPNTKWPGNGCGLCNQLFKVINSLCYIDSNQHNIYFDLFSKDYNSGETMTISSIIDLEEMRNKYNYKIYDIIDFDYKINQYHIHNDFYVFRSYQQNLELFTEHLNKIIFKKQLEDLSLEIINKKVLNSEIVNLAHIRIDIDFKNHMFATSGEQSYLDLIEDYRREINNNCDKSIPLVILIEETNHDFINELRKDYDVITFEKSDITNINPDINGREVFALIDLLIGKNLKVNTFVGTNKSSFSIVLNQLKRYKKSIMIK
jgi:hypothetical protein